MVQEYENIYKTIVENSAVAITMADENELIISWNSFAESLLGMDKNDLDLVPVKSLYPDDEWKKIRSLNIRQKGMQHHLETRIKRKDGRLIDVDVSLTVLKNSAGRITGSIGIMRDITERKQAEQVMIEALKMKKDFISMVSHELNTPLTTIVGSVDIILDGSTGPINPEQKDYLLTTKKSVERLQRLISDVLDYQTLNTTDSEFDMQAGNVNDVLKSVQHEMTSFAETAGISLKANLEENLPHINFDYGKIAQVLRNLVENAIKFSKKGCVTISTVKQDKFIQVSVEDTGIGIKAEDIKILFQIFSQISSGSERLPGSTGLGLALSKIIIEKHAGKIWVESEYGKGSTFFFQLPLL